MLSSLPGSEQILAYVAAQCKTHPPGTPSATILEAIQKAERAVRKAEKQKLPREALAQAYCSVGAAYLQSASHDAPESSESILGAPDPDSASEIAVFRDAASGKHLYRPGGSESEDPSAAAERVTAEIKQMQRANTRAKFEGTPKVAVPIVLPHHESAVSWLQRSVEYDVQHGKAAVLR